MMNSMSVPDGILSLLCIKTKPGGSHGWLFQHGPILVIVTIWIVMGFPSHRHDHPTKVQRPDFANAPGKLLLTRQSVLLCRAITIVVVGSHAETVQWCHGGNH